MAFTLLMRLPQRLEAERESDSDALAAYLDDPLRFFIPARLMRGALLVLVDRLLAQTGRSRLHGGLVLCRSGVGLVDWRRPTAAVADRAAVIPNGSSRCCCPSSRWSPTCSARSRRSSSALGCDRAARRATKRGRHRAGASRVGRRRRPSRGRREPAAAVGRRLRRDTGARSHDAAAGHRGDPLRRDDR